MKLAYVTKSQSNIFVIKNGVCQAFILLSWRQTKIFLKHYYQSARCLICVLIILNCFKRAKIVRITKFTFNFPSKMMFALFIIALQERTK